MEAPDRYGTKACKNSTDVTRCTLYSRVNVCVVKDQWGYTHRKKSAVNFLSDSPEVCRPPQPATPQMTTFIQTTSAIFR